MIEYTDLKKLPKSNSWTSINAYNFMYLLSKRLLKWAMKLPQLFVFLEYVRRNSIRFNIFHIFHLNFYNFFKFNKLQLICSFAYKSYFLIMFYVRKNCQQISRLRLVIKKISALFEPRWKMQNFWSLHSIDFYPFLRLEWGGIDERKHLSKTFFGIYRNKNFSQ